jgi:3-deoxy-D-manno-octulosonic-acid transferase
MAECKKQNIPFYSVSSIFRKEQSFFKYDWFAKQLNNVSHFFVQDNNSKELLQTIGFSNCTVAGDTRFDSVVSNTQKAVSIPLIEKFSKNKTTIICGSTWPKDEAILAKYIKENPNYKYIIAPHEIHHISDLKKQTNALLFSKADSTNISNSNVLIIDGIGILSNIYKYGNLAYIGGGFGSGIHNILEAVTFGLPVIFGPNHQKFNEATELIALGGAKSISNYTELTLAIDSFTNFDQTIATNYIKKNSGATIKILNSIISRRKSD